MRLPRPLPTLHPHHQYPTTPHPVPKQVPAGFVWDVISTLPPALQHTGAQVVRFASDYVKVDESKGVKSFNWTEFKNAIDDLETVDLVMEGYSSNPLAPAPVVQLPTAFASALTNKLKMPVVEDGVAETIKDVLEHLDYAKQDGVADFHVIPADSTKKPPTKAESVWEYRLLIMAQNPRVSNDFYAQVAVLQVTAQKEHESDWAPIKDDLRATSVKVTMMKLAATQGFRHPVPTATPSTKA
ncbi:hypothetical protein RSAG8_07823, partial [Rhizoctonia solani AG-8 WAC10335]